MTKILIVDNDADNAQLLQNQLTIEGFEISVAFQGHTALTLDRSQRPDLVILELALPDINGLDFCRQFRRISTAPLVILTTWQDEISKVLALELGADIYLTKPYSFRELLARLRALLRQIERIHTQLELNKTTNSTSATTLVSTTPSQLATAQKPYPSSSKFYHFGDLHLDLARRSVKLGEKLLVLKPKEYELLVFLVQHQGQVLSRETLLEQVWGYSYEGGSRTVDVHIHWLREKLEQHSDKPQYLHTLFGVGYKFQFLYSVNAANYSTKEKEPVLAG